MNISFHSEGLRDLKKIMIKEKKIALKKEKSQEKRYSIIKLFKEKILNLDKSLF